MFSLTVQIHLLIVSSSYPQNKEHKHTQFMNLHQFLVYILHLSLTFIILVS